MFKKYYFISLFIAAFIFVGCGADPKSDAEATKEIGDRFDKDAPVFTTATNNSVKENKISALTIVATDISQSIEYHLDC